jgi:predicted nucleotidyltransferase
MDFKAVIASLLRRFSDSGVKAVLSGGFALSTLGIFRFTRDIDFVIPAENVPAVEAIMTELGYEKQAFSNPEILSYVSPLKVMGQVDFLVARRKYSRAMIERARDVPILDGALTVKALRAEDLIGLKLQALLNDPQNRQSIDAPDIQRLLKLHRSRMDMDLVREYFRLFDKEKLLDEWLCDIE